MAMLLALHVLAAVAWVGGMFFAYVVLRPAAGPLEPPVRLALWQRVFGRFFPWVWASIAILLASGYTMLFLGFGGFKGAGPHIHVMQATGIVMMLLFLHLFFAPWRRFSEAVKAEDFASAALSLNQIRRIVAINLVLGLITVAAGASGRFWP
ncbi:MAG: CopD family protein [Methyloceanibacter sp.]